MKTQRDIRTNRRTEEQKNRQTDKRTNGEANGKTNRPTNMMKIPISAKAEEQKYKNVFYSYPSSFSVEDFF